ncbi:hypothetical protein LguiA_014180 [Lonicera macranthoides]
MAQVAKTEVKTEIKCSPEKFYEFYKNNLKGLTTIFPNIIIKTIEGDENCVGSVRLWKFNLEKPVSAKLKIEEINDEKKSITYNITEGDILELYKSFMAKLEVKKEEGGGNNFVKWTYEFEKAHEGVPNPDHYGDLTSLICKGLDGYLLLH